MSGITANAYLKWIDEGADPPVNLSIRSWQAATRTVLARMRQARTAMVGGGWEQIEAWIHGTRSLDTLTMWADFSHKRTARLRAGTHDRAALALARARLRLARTTAGHPCVHALRGLLRRRTHGLTKSQKEVAKTLLEEWKSSVDEQAKPLTDRIASRHFRRERTASMQCKANGLCLTPDQTRELPPRTRQLARRAATLLGLRGGFVSADTDLALEVLRHISDRGVREQLWRQRQGLHAGESTLVAMLAARHAEALAEGHSSYAAYSLFGRVIASPRKVLGLLGDTLEGLRTPQRKLDRRLLTEARACGWSSVELWDRDFLIERLRQRHRFWEEPVGVFPVEATLRRMVPELMAIGGWRVLYSQRHGAGVKQRWCWHLRHRSGRLAQVWVAPYNPNDTEDRSTAGEMSLVRPHWGPGESKVEGVITIDLSLDGLETCFSLQHVTYICHEMGHVLHALAMANHHHDEFRDFPEDMGEFPSQLLEQMAADPQALARWASPTGPALARRPSFWRSHLASSTAATNNRDVLSAWLDVSVHQQRDPDRVSFEALCQKAHARFDIPGHPDSRSHFDFFVWGYYAAVDYCYPLGIGLAHAMTPRRPDLTVDGGALAVVFEGLLKNVLRKGVDTKSLLSQWKVWTGQELEDSIRTGMHHRTHAIGQSIMAIAKTV